MMLLAACLTDPDTLPTDSEAAACTETPWFADVDGDGFGVGEAQGEACTAPTGAALNGDDCDDLDATIAPGAAEVCDGADNDCDALIDDFDPEVSGAPSLYRDADGDGYGAGDAVAGRCEVPEGYSRTDGDCDDGAATVNPEADERCEPSGVDEDCDGLVDGDDPSLDPSELMTLYADVDGDGHGDPEVTAAGCGATAGWTEADDDCDDRDGEVNPDVTEVCGNGIDDDCDGGPGSCGLSGDITLSSTTAAAKIMGGIYNGQLGRAGSLTRVGDQNGDGFDDVFVSAPLYAGAAYLFYGPVSGRTSVATADITLAGDDSSEGLGTALLGGIDFDGDGARDLAVTGWSGTLEDHAVLIYSGPGAGSFTSVDADIAVYAEGSEVSPECLVSGDFDGDGVADLAVGALGDYDDRGAYVWRGPLTGSTVSTGSAWLSTDGQSISEAMAAGDLDGDGVDELITTVRGGVPSTGDTDEVVLVYAGGTGGSLVAATDTLARLVDVPDPTSSIGSSLTTGDLDGDGLADLVMGALGSDVGGSQAGAVYVAFSPVTGDVDASAAGAAVYSVESSGHFGIAVAASDDITGDGRADLLVGAWLADNHGTATIIPGPFTASTDITDASATLTGEAWSDMAGWAVAYPGDVDGDGVSDLLVGAGYESSGAAYGGAAYLYSGGGL